MYILYGYSPYTISHWRISVVKHSVYYNLRPNESCWMIPGTVSPDA